MYKFSFNKYTTFRPAFNVFPALPALPYSLTLPVLPASPFYLRFSFILCHLSHNPGYMAHRQGENAPHVLENRTHGTPAGGNCAICPQKPDTWHTRRGKMPHMSPKTGHMAHRQGENASHVHKSRTHGAPAGGKCAICPQTPDTWRTCRGKMPHMSPKAGHMAQPMRLGQRRRGGKLQPMRLGQQRRAEGWDS